MSKIILIGPCGAGKSSWLQSLLKQHTVLEMDSTIGAQFNTYTINDIRMNFWDTAGQERFHSIIPLFFRNCDIVIIFHPLNDPCYQTFKTWYQLSKEHASHAYFIVVGSKKDTIDVHVPTIDPDTDASECLDEKNKIIRPHFCTSVYDIKSINRVINHITDLISRGLIVNSTDIISRTQNINKGEDNRKSFCCSN